MARRADLADLDQKAIAVAVVGNGFDELKMPGGQPLDPVFLTGAGPETGLTFRDGFFD